MNDEVMNQAPASERPVMDVVMNCTCAALDQTDCNYIVALFSREKADFKIGNITLNLDDEQIAAEAFAQVISQKDAAGKQLLRLLATVIDILPEDIWAELDMLSPNGKLATEVLSEGLSTSGLSSVRSGLSL